MSEEKFYDTDTSPTCGDCQYFEKEETELSKGYCTKREKVTYIYRLVGPCLYFKLRGERNGEETKFRSRKNEEPCF